MRIHFLLNRRAVPEPSPVLLDVFERLRRRGAVVDDSIPEECLARVSDLAPRHDLYVLKSHTELALSIAGTLDRLGARLLNPYRACLATQDAPRTSRGLLRTRGPTSCRDTWHRTKMSSRRTSLGRRSSA